LVSNGINEDGSDPDVMTPDDVAALKAAVEARRA